MGIQIRNNEPRATDFERRATYALPEPRSRESEQARSIAVAREPGPGAAARTREIVPRQRSEGLTRVVNVGLAALALLVLAPVLLIVAIAIKLTSPGPIVYRQTRIGLDRRARRGPSELSLYDRRMQDLGGAVFSIYKFRTMYVDAERGSGAVWARKLDSRVTPIGKFLRKCRLDETPQLLNVIRGEMNIVGPRPERPSIFARLRDGISEYPLRQRAKPGITGWAQVNQAYDECLDDVRRKVSLDLEYLERQGIAEDLRILARTVPVVLFRTSGW